MGENRWGYRMDQLMWPRDVIVEKKHDSLIICDPGNRRVIQWPRQNGKNGQTIISDILCNGLTMDNYGNLYSSDYLKNEVRRWKIGDKKGIVVVGGNDYGDSLTQLSYPRGVIVDRMGNVYVADSKNNRVMRYSKGSKEGSLVVGVNGKGRKPNQFNGLLGLSFDRQGNLYAVDFENDQVQKFDIFSN